MIYAGDQWIQYPVKDLYDTQIMAMSIAAAKDMYDKGQKRLDDFYDKYGDFMSPFAKDMDRYKEIVNGVNDVINNAYANGIDPLRSPEGRALVAQAIRSVNPAEINAMKANAKVGYTYLDAMSKLRADGKFSQAQEDFDMMLNKQTPFSEFSTSNGNGGFNVWNRPSPIQATTLRELTQDSYKGRTPRTLTAEDFKNDPRLAGKYAYDPRYEWTGYLYSDLLKNAPGVSASLAADPRAAFFRDQARQMVIASGKEPTAENVEAQYQRNIADANTWALVDPTRTADQFALDNHRTANDIYAHRKNKELDHYYWTIEQGDKDGDKTHNIFRRAEKLADNVKQKGVVGEHTQYERSEQYYQWIDPVIQAGMHLAKDKDSGETVPIYTFNGRDLTKTGSIYHLGQDGNMYKSRISSDISNGDYTFVADGNMRARKLESRNGKDYYRYWVSGKLIGPTGTVIKTAKNNHNVREGDNVTWIQVKERDYNYGQTQKKQ